MRPYPSSEAFPALFPRTMLPPGNMDFIGHMAFLGVIGIVSDSLRGTHMLPTGSMGFFARARDLAAKAGRQAHMRPNIIAEEIFELLTPESYLDLVTQYGGTRLYVPVCKRGKNAKIPGLDSDAATALADAFGGLFLQVPVAREFRAIVYWERGFSNAQVAAKLGLSESGVNKLRARIKAGKTSSGATFSKAALRQIEAAKSIRLDPEKDAGT